MITQQVSFLHFELLNFVIYFCVLINSVPFSLCPLMLNERANAIVDLEQLCLIQACVH